MSNQVPVLALPHQETALARAFGEAHRRYTRLKNFAEGVRGYLFQGRFNSCILDQDPLLSAARYVELNPVRVGMVKHAWGYPWSSARYHTGVSEIDPLVKDRTLLGLITNWKEFLGSGDDQATVRLRLATRTGRPAGGEEFIAVVEGLTGRDLRKGPPGRPRHKNRFMFPDSPGFPEQTSRVRNGSALFVPASPHPDKKFVDNANPLGVDRNYMHRELF